MRGHGSELLIVTSSIRRTSKTALAQPTRQKKALDLERHQYSAPCYPTAGANLYYHFASRLSAYSHIPHWRVLLQAFTLPQAVPPCDLTDRANIVDLSSLVHSTTVGTHADCFVQMLYLSGIFTLLLVLLIYTKLRMLCSCSFLCSMGSRSRDPGLSEPDAGKSEGKERKHKHRDRDLSRSKARDSEVHAPPRSSHKERVS